MNHNYFDSDQSPQRTLKTAATSDVSGMTIEECASFCTPLGFQFAGVEFGRVSVPRALNASRLTFRLLLSF
jgi:hypothetical protein